MSITPKSYLGCTIFTTQEENGVKCFLAGLSELRPKCGSTCYILLIETHFYGCGMDLLMNYGHKMSSELRSRLLLMFTDEAQNRWFLRLRRLAGSPVGSAMKSWILFSSQQSASFFQPWALSRVPHATSIQSVFTHQTMTCNVRSPELHMQHQSNLFFRKP